MHVHIISELRYYIFHNYFLIHPYQIYCLITKHPKMICGIFVINLQHVTTKNQLVRVKIKQIILIF